MGETTGVKGTSMGDNSGITRSGSARSAWWVGSDPASELQHLWGELSRLFEHSSQATEMSRHWMPLAEEEDSGNAYVVRAELPGIPRERVNVEIDGRELHIHGSIEEAADTSALRRRTGAFSYGIRIPADVDPVGVKADLADGVLTVTLPKSGDSAPRRVEIGSPGDATGD
ncbi:Hsp20/alpha crystallin family protein [Streptomyces sp. NPDC048441]|uniref:Hsp20/alpha crystallin family protein n=1 Tax=Streptomyces sp. NPDC048441 TaxID=3365552 RepID=UPI003715AF29